jgi:hypothetical protein
LFKAIIFQVREVRENVKPEDSTSNKLIQFNSNYILNMHYVISTELMSTLLSVIYFDCLVLKGPTSSQPYKLRSDTKRLKLLLKFKLKTTMENCTI